MKLRYLLSIVMSLFLLSFSNFGFSKDILEPKSEKLEKDIFIPVCEAEGKDRFLYNTYFETVFCFRGIAVCATEPKEFLKEPLIEQYTYLEDIELTEPPPPQYKVQCVDYSGRVLQNESPFCSPGKGKLKPTCAKIETKEM